MTRADERAAVPGWAKAPQWAGDPERVAAIADATARDRKHYLTGGMTDIECRTCHAHVMVKKTSAHHTSVQWNDDALARCSQISEIRASGGNAALLPTCPRLSASIDHGVAEGIIPSESPEEDPDGYW
ncbi:MULTISPECIES: hypothetical protein [Gordonia]|uniref:Uncharacterized protein n=2 Tax=Gordonia TaxID=2053 RepID=L7LL39_9ACTN|nr:MULTISPECIES: hypothetical protein [Gordonia]AUH68047.1 hypothetical protein CXX93_06450 [Gordonia sp. YC-JH1]KJR09191.1 hypothetical protein UG54_05340 [Gordonia sihwensis]KXT58901.1 hypothetical protein Y710_01245 [Gordonia sp. QH-12]MBY4569310.1 hypothetical protein [Gordonia sihwensis]WFN92224.1 hypothetical protein P5P27_15800 [Gordonia sihwensis]